MREIAAIPAIVDHHAGDAAFLWLRRRHEIDGPLLGETDIGRIDQRLDANIEGLVASGKAGWEAALALFADYPEPGEAFLLGILALLSGEKDAVGEAVDACAGLGAFGINALSGAIARVHRETLRPFVTDWLDSAESAIRCLGLCALRHNRVDPGARLDVLIQAADPQIRCQALRLAGVLKRHDLARPIAESLAGETDRECLEAALALCLLDEAPHAHPALDRLVLGRSGQRAAAIELRLLTTPVKAGKTWLQKWLEQPAMREAATAAVGLFGDRSIMPWLIGRMREPDVAHAAGLALRDLFEVDFNDLALFSSDPAELGEAFAEVSAVLPVADKVEAWWDEGRGGKGYGTFRSMRRIRLDALRAAFDHPETRLQDWRQTRHFPAWL
ncbi:hypothetical protein LB518_08505 [Mesorhizobium sp. BR1-1-16]|uniref:hypothetical protein n=1 Tax=Mesorhizobium sp. BR1-1-16 TaxID=2876653 RepID=UPI001CCA0BE1|nr:hypothetical protein [Mesorhizobium sp. BR1-1-16]MBZ9936332.1 hypothetical protein [Mesorhizobium sp. BR1-1-16]